MAVNFIFCEHFQQVVISFVLFVCLCHVFIFILSLPNCFALYFLNFGFLFSPHFSRIKISNLAINWLCVDLKSVANTIVSLLCLCLVLLWCIEIQCCNKILEQLDFCCWTNTRLLNTDWTFWNDICQYNKYFVAVIQQ